MFMHPAQRPGTRRATGTVDADKRPKHPQQPKLRPHLHMSAEREGHKKTNNKKKACHTNDVAGARSLIEYHREKGIENKV